MCMNWTELTRGQMMLYQLGRFSHSHIVMPGINGQYDESSNKPKYFKHVA